MTVGTDLVERIWARDPTVWTGRDEADWLGWLEEPFRVRERLAGVRLPERTGDVVLLGMGGSSLAPEVMRRTFGIDGFHVLDSTHPAAVRAIEHEVDLESAIFVVSSKSGSTVETRSHMEYFYERAGKRGDRFVAVTDPGSQLEKLAQERGFAAVVHGEPTIGGRYSALSPFGIVPAALVGLDVERLVERAGELADACKSEDGNPGLELGLALGEGWREGRDKVCAPNPGGFGLWMEQLIAESTGKDGKGLVPAPGEPGDGQDRQWHELELDDPYDLGAEFYRWEFATAVAGSILGIHPFDQPNVQEAKDRTNAILAEGGEIPLEPEGDVLDVLGQAEAGKSYVAILAFVDPARAGELEPLVARARRTGCVVTTGLGPRYLHSTGQLHKGGPATGHFVQVVDDTGEELPIPGSPFGFGRLLRAQAAGDYAALKERGRPVCRINLEDVV
jgi:hypothetical protein